MCYLNSDRSSGNGRTEVPVFLLVFCRSSLSQFPETTPWYLNVFFSIFKPEMACEHSCMSFHGCQHHDALSKVWRGGTQAHLFPQTAKATESAKLCLASLGEHLCKSPRNEYSYQLKQPLVLPDEDGHLFFFFGH